MSPTQWPCSVQFLNYAKIILLKNVKNVIHKIFWYFSNLLLNCKQAADDIETEKDDETPNSEMIERMVEKLEGAQSQQKNLFLIIFQVGS